MKKIVCLLLVALMFVSFCACGSEDTDSTTTTTAAASDYEQALMGKWSRNNSDIVMELSADNKGSFTQKGIITSLYWEADASGIVLKTNMVGENVKLSYTLDGDTLTVQNEDGTKVVYKKVK